MCGISGFTGPAEPSVLNAMVQALHHRGPDEEGFYSDGTVNLGMRRLNIVDLASGSQPIHNEDRSVWTIFNGEIYNHEPLRVELERRGHRFYTHHSDTETLVHLYEEYGDGFMDRLNGMFAIAIWDCRRKRLLLARDRAGVKPLNWALVNGKLLFGSEIKALLKHPACPREPYFPAIYHFLSFKHVPAPWTAFNGIQTLLPGDRLIWENGAATIEKWWRIDARERVENGKNLVARIRGTLEDATRLRMRCDVPFGAYLSGGVDSSAVVSQMSRFASHPVKTFALGYEDEFKNKQADIIYARKVAQLFKTEHHEHIMTCRELEEGLPDVLRSFDQPFSGTISTFFLTRVIGRHVKVALSGDGADEIFGSYLSHRTAGPLAKYAQWRRLGLPGPAALSAEQKAQLAPCNPAFLEDLYVQTGGDEGLWRARLLPWRDSEKRTLLAGAFRAGTVGCSTEALLKDYFKGLTATDPLNRILEMEWKTFFPDQVLAFVDLLSMAHSVEVRSPFLDYRLVELVAGIPGEMKIKDGCVKFLLKRVVKGWIPDEVLERPKEGFVLPVFEWMTLKMEGWLRDCLAPNRVERMGWLDAEVVQDFVDRYFAGERALAGRLWNLAMLVLWWEAYFQ